MRFSMSNFLWDKACPDCGFPIDHETAKQIGLNEIWRCPSCGCEVLIDDHHVSRRATITSGIALAIVVFVPGFMIKIALLVPLTIISLHKFFKWRKKQ